MRYGNVGWEEFNRMRPADSVALTKALGELVKAEDELRAKLAGATR